MEINYEAPGGYFSQHFPKPGPPGSTVVAFERVEGGFRVVPPPGVDWADYEPQPDLEVSQPNDAEGNPSPPLLQPQPDLRIPRDAWLYYQQQHGAGEQPSKGQVDSWEPPQEEAEPPAPVTDVEITSKVISDQMTGLADKIQNAKTTSELKAAMLDLAQLLSKLIEQ